MVGLLYLTLCMPHRKTNYQMHLFWLFFYPAPLPSVQFINMSIDLSKREGHSHAAQCLFLIYLNMHEHCAHPFL